MTATISSPATQRSLATVFAVKNRHAWGFFAARRYAERRGSTPLMWMIALRLECERALRAFPHAIARSSS